MWRKLKFFFRGFKKLATVTISDIDMMFISGIKLMKLLGFSPLFFYSTLDSHPLFVSFLFIINLVISMDLFWVSEWKYVSPHICLRTLNYRMMIRCIWELDSLRCLSCLVYPDIHAGTFKILMETQWILKTFYF